MFFKQYALALLMAAFVAGAPMHLMLRVSFGGGPSLSKIDGVNVGGMPAVMFPSRQTAPMNHDNQPHGLDSGLVVAEEPSQALFGTEATHKKEMPSKKPLPHWMRCLHHKICSAFRRLVMRMNIASLMGRSHVRVYHRKIRYIRHP